MPRFPRPAMDAHLSPLMFGGSRGGCCPRDVSDGPPAFGHPLSGELHLSREEDLMLRYGQMVASIFEKRGA